MTRSVMCVAGLALLFACGGEDKVSSPPPSFPPRVNVETDIAGVNPAATPDIEASGTVTPDPASSSSGTAESVMGINEGGPNLRAPSSVTPNSGTPSSEGLGAESDSAGGLAPEVCEEGNDFVNVVYFGGEGCIAACQVRGLQCAQGFENLDAQCGPGAELALGCAEASHDSDFCSCTADGNPIPGLIPEVKLTDVDAEIPVPAPGPQCRAVGWATRIGRDGAAFQVTGGGGATPVVVDNFDDLQALASGSEARVIYIDGPVGAGFQNGSGDRLDIGSNKTIAGLIPGTELNAAIIISGNDSSNVILRNVVINGPGSDGEQSWDNINIARGARNIWVDHCEFWDGQDGNADVVRGADNVTFTWSVFGYRDNSTHNFSNLVASSDNEPESEGRLNITLMFNHFRGVEQRSPRCRFGDIHVVNNLFTTDGLATSNAISAGVDCQILTENNHFIGIRQPIHQREGGTNELRGENLFEETTGNTTGYGGEAFEPPYEYNDILVPAAQVQGLLSGRVGATLQNPTVCDWE